MDWNKLEWVNPRNSSGLKNPFCASSKKFYFKDNDKTLHLVGCSKLEPLDLEEFYNRKEYLTNKKQFKLEL